MDPVINGEALPSTFVLQTAYRPVCPLRGGGMSNLWIVEDLATSRRAVMKTIASELFEDPVASERFRAENRILAKLSHPNIVGLYGIFHVNHQRAMIMELVDGQTIEHRLKSGPLGISESLQIATQILSALDYAHSRAIVHRDLKPSNVMLMPDGGVKLLDFGISKCASEPTLTFPGMTMGSVYYMSPEQVRGDAVDGRSDIYSLGAVLFEMITGQRLFTVATTFGVMEHHLKSAPTDARRLNPEIPRSLNDVIRTALAKDPEMRFASAAAFSEALASLKSAIPTSAEPRKLRFRVRIRIRRPLFKTWTPYALHPLRIESS